METRRIITGTAAALLAIMALVAVSISGPAARTDTEISTTTQLSTTTQYYVSLQGNDKTGDGTIDAPFATLKTCVTKMPSDSTDHTCVMCGGRYTDEIKLTKTSSLTVIGYTGETTAACASGAAIIDGSDVIDLEWTVDNSADIPASSTGCVWRSSAFSSLDSMPYQLWVEDSKAKQVILTPARWPNARLDDFSAFSGKTKTGENNVRFTGPLAYYTDSDHPVESSSAAWPEGKELYMKDDEEHDPSLAESGMNFTDTLLVQTVGAMGGYTIGSKVTSHSPGSGELYYQLPSNWEIGSSDLSSLYNTHDWGTYMFEGHPKLLDSEYEWVVDTEMLQLLVYLPECADPNKASLRGRYRDVMLTVNGNDGALNVKDMTFFSSTWQLKGSSLSMDGVQMLYPNSNKRSIWDGSPPTVLTSMSHGNEGFQFKFENSRVLMADAPAVFEKIGDNAVISNNLFEGIGYAGGSSATVTSIGNPANVYYYGNTIQYFNCYDGITPATTNTVTMNRLHQQGAEIDGGAIHIQEPFQDGTVVTKNWISDMEIKGIRTDRVNALGVLGGTNCTVSYNIASNTFPIAIKGNQHKVIGNAVVNHKILYSSKGVANDWSCALGVVVYGEGQVPSWVNPTENDETLMEHNVADCIMNVTDDEGVEKVAGPADDSRICAGSPSDAVNANCNLGGCKAGQSSSSSLPCLTGQWWSSQFKGVDASPPDFRPADGSLLAEWNVGPYSNSDEWVPGTTLAWE